MNLYQLLNITSSNVEDLIQKSIDDTKIKLEGLTEQQTCKIYSSYITENLRKNHVTNRLINTSELGFQYEHQFNLVPVDLKHCYLIDLTFSQFPSVDFPKLKESGFQLVADSDFKRYLEDVCCEYREISLEDAYHKKSRFK